MSATPSSQCILFHDATPPESIASAQRGAYVAVADELSAPTLRALIERSERGDLTLHLARGGVKLLREAALTRNLASLSLSGVALGDLLFPPTLRALRLSSCSGALDGLIVAPLETLALDGGSLDTSALGRHATLVALLIANASPASVVLPANLRALRLIAIPLASLDVLRGASSIEHFEGARLDTLESLDALLSLPNLRALGLEGCWRLDLHATIAFLSTLSLLELRIDIGGRRKNDEIYKRHPVAPLSPFPSPERWRTQAAPHSFQEPGENPFQIGAIPPDAAATQLPWMTSPHP